MPYSAASSRCVFAPVIYSAWIVNTSSGVSFSRPLRCRRAIHSLPQSRSRQNTVGLIIDAFGLFRTGEFTEPDKASPALGRVALQHALLYLPNLHPAILHVAGAIRQDQIDA